jgi:hypothetical protein
MVCRSAHTRMPRACGKPGHFLWMHAERRSPAPVSPRDNRSSFHISTAGRSTAWGRRGEPRAVDKWHVSVDKPHPLGRRRSGERVSREFSGAKGPRQPAPLELRIRRGFVLSSMQFMVLHRPRTPSFDGAQSTAGILPQSMRVACAILSPSTSPHPLRRLLRLRYVRGTEEKNVFPQFCLPL